MRFLLPLPLLGLLIGLPVGRAATPDVPFTLLVNTLPPPRAVSPSLLGLSYETSLLLPNAQGEHYFRSDNRPLLNTFKTLGIKSLRIGGSSVDTATFAIPNEADLRDFLDFAKAAHVKVIYSVRLKELTAAASPPDADANPRSAAAIARFIHGYAPEVIESFSIGNEPGYMKDYAVYSAHWRAVRDAIVEVYPTAVFCGPDQDPAPELDKHMAADFGSPEGRLVNISQHTYPFGCSFKNPKARADVTKLVFVDADAGREMMLSPTAYDAYKKIYDGITGSISGKPVSFSLTETNSFWFSGLKGASDRYASALWAVDYLYWWAGHGAKTVNFHTGDRTGGDVTLPCQYAAFVTSTEGYEIRPLAYGMKAFDLGGHGQRLAVTPSADNQHDMVEYATLSDEKMVYVTLINKAHGPSATPTAVEIKADVPLDGASAQVIFLRAKNDDIAAAGSDVTLGDAPIRPDGTWNGQWASAAESQGMIHLTVPPASVAVVRAKVR